MTLSLSSKAQTLEKLTGLLNKAEILPILRFTAQKYNSHKSRIISDCLQKFSSQVIIRSSSETEDKPSSSNAGFYTSVLNVELNTHKIDHAITQVINSYGEISPQDEVFIQPMLENVLMCGVIFTADIDTLSPYYIINYDTSGSTTNVTAGHTNELKTFISHKGSNNTNDEYLSSLIMAAKECETLFNNEYLDIEFAFSENKLYILQVREIVINNKINLSDINLDVGLEKIYKKIHKLNTQHPRLLGEKTIFGVMPDWNPAEIIGLKPQKLALSLYKELITDKIWAYQRDNYGYRNLRSFPILVTFLGIPFIDVRVSFNSFIPKNLSNKIASKLVNFYLKQLAKNKEFHDKIEFKIVFSCYFFGLSNKLQTLLKYNFTQLEIETIEQSLLGLTKNIINNKKGLYKQDIDKIHTLEEHLSEIKHSPLPLIDKIYWLIEDCKRFGTLPFAGVARAAFIAKQFLDSMVSEKIITLEEYHLYLNSLNTVSKQMNEDKQTLSDEDFICKYGHLRPGTYDITSFRYDEKFDEYFSSYLEPHTKTSYAFSPEQKQKIQLLLNKNKLDLNTDEFLLFIKEAIEGREYLKFIFTKSLSQTLKYIEELGARYQISRKDLAHLDIQKILTLYSSLEHEDIKKTFNHNIKKNKQCYHYIKAIKLPSVILNADDIYSFTLENHKANFITLNKIQSSVVHSNRLEYEELNNKIICISSADPGYDYLFTKKIAGLITCFGGANSHMAIRCAELGIPAVIGCGENKFQQYNKANIISINSLNQTVQIIS